MSQPAKKEPPRAVWEKPLKKLEFRADGWPLCPACGHDELASNEIPAKATDRLLCLVCGWVGTIEPRHR